MLTYSIEQNAERVYHPKTKEYFQEVLAIIHKWKLPLGSRNALLSCCLRIDLQIKGLEGII